DSRTFWGHLWAPCGEGEAGAADHLRSGAVNQRLAYSDRSTCAKWTDQPATGRPGFGFSVATDPADGPADLETGLQSLQRGLFHFGGSTGSDRQTQGAV